MKHPRILPTLLSCALVLAGCGDTTSTDDGAEDVQADSGDVDDEQPVEDEEPADDGDGEQPAADPGEPLTGEDGWAELHDVSLPDPGRMELVVNGQAFTTDVRCGQDPVRNDEASGSMFLFSLLESGTTDDGRDFQIMVNRAIAVGSQVDDMYDTGGSSAQVTLVIPGEDGNSSSVVRSPNDDDPQGALLPLVHVDPAGGFTMEGTMQAFQGDEAVVGEAVLAGQCQDGWPG